MNNKKLVHKTPKQVRESEEAGFSPSLYGQKTLMEFLSRTPKQWKLGRKQNGEEKI